MQPCKQNIWINYYATREIFIHKSQDKKTVKKKKENPCITFDFRKQNLHLELTLFELPLKDNFIKMVH